MARLKSLASSKVLNVTNVPSLESYEGLLSKSQVEAFRSKFMNVGGSWCCAPKGAQPRSAHFSLWRAA